MTIGVEDDSLRAQHSLFGCLAKAVIIQIYYLKKNNIIDSKDDSCGGKKQLDIQIQLKSKDASSESRLNMLI